ncbi:MAG: hypothetical protein QHH07_09040 [Sedimentisphaerales bacterium]|nr:hypothetical protein [Sedimentisphaerales bacterium]
MPVGLPFGTIYPEMVQYLTSICDGCVGRLPGGQVPLCAQTSRSIMYRDVGPDEQVVNVSQTVTAKVVPGAKWDPLVRKGTGR